MYWTDNLQAWYEKAHREIGLPVIHPADRQYAIYPKQFYNHPVLKQDKQIDYIFIGSFCFTADKTAQQRGFEARKWTIHFAKKHFTNNSYFVNTTKNNGLTAPWVLLGSYDKTNEDLNWVVPKLIASPVERDKFDNNYFSRMAQSKFCLCPAGDEPYSMRFYEALMSKTIPIVDNVKYTHRTYAESKLDYKFYLSDEDEYTYREDWVEHNYDVFMHYHTLKYRRSV